MKPGLATAPGGCLGCCPDRSGPPESLVAADTPFPSSESMDVLERHRQMVERFPENELGRFSLGKALFDLGRHGEAEEHLKVALRKKPDWMVVQILIGKCALELGRRAEAIAAFGRARDLAVSQHHEGPLAEMEGLLEDLQG